MEGIEAVEVYSKNSALYRYRLPIAIVRNLRHEKSRCSPEFDVGGRQWCIHVGEKATEEDTFLSLHLKSCSPGAVGVHFKISIVCVKDPLRSKSKTFNCTFKGEGSAWGLHQFVPIEHLLYPEKGYLYIAEETGEKLVDIEVTLQLSEELRGEQSWTPQRVRRDSSGAQRETGIPYRSVSRSMPLSNNNNNNNILDKRQPFYQGLLHPSPTASGRTTGGVPNRAANQPLIPFRGVSPRAQHEASGVGAPYLRNGGRNSTESGARNDYQNPYKNSPFDPNAGDTGVNAGVGLFNSGEDAVNSNAVPRGHYYLRAPLTYPFEHLESLCDMTFDAQGVRIKAHRCVIGARMKPLLPAQVLPLQPGCVVAIAVPLDVFTTFLRYVYTEEVPEKGVLSAELLLDLYLLSFACEFFDMCAVCLQFARPMLTPQNILPIVLTRYNAADDVLTALYLNVLLDHYDMLIQDPKFEEIPGHLFRKLSLIMYHREEIHAPPIPPMKVSLAKQLASLAETGEYSDVDLVVGPQRYTVPAHRFILASRSSTFALSINPQHPTPLPNFTLPELNFSLRSWRKLLIGIYQRHLDTELDFSAEDITIVYKMHSILGLDGQLKKEADSAFSSQNALRVLVYAVKHQLSELQDKALRHVASHFGEMARTDPQVWELINELPQGSVVSLMRSIMEYA